MMHTVFDIETTMLGPNKSPSPYHHENFLVSVGWKCKSKYEGYVCIQHNEEPTTPDARNQIQFALDNTSVFIAHNVKFDLSWLLECGFTYDGDVYDTMIYEYLEAGGTYADLDLSSSCRRHNLDVKFDSTKEYLKDGIGFEAMPWDVVKEYGIQDVRITWDLYWKQQELLNATGT